MKAFGITGALIVIGIIAVTRLDRAPKPENVVPKPVAVKIPGVLIAMDSALMDSTGNLPAYAKAMLCGRYFTTGMATIVNKKIGMTGLMFIFFGEDGHLKTALADTSAIEWSEAPGQLVPSVKVEKNGNFHITLSPEAKMEVNTCIKRLKPYHPRTTENPMLHVS